MNNAKIIVMFIFLLVLSSFCFAQDWVYSAESVTADAFVDARVDINPEQDDYLLEYVTANLSFFPIDTWKQDVLETRIEPEHTREARHIFFRWDKPTEDKLEYSIISRVKIENKYKEVKSKVGFPIAPKDIPEEVRVFLEPTDNIDADESNIRLLANSIAAGEDDLYVVVFKMADWTKQNIKYDLSTLTESVSQKSSWVLENRNGVCDELTNLFIAMLRSVGVPAKFVSGIAYTNSPLFPESWGPHGWAEVYFPGYGWVEFDVTYGQFGFVDPSHIKMKDSIDSVQPASSYVWKGRDVELAAQPIEVDVELVDYSGIVPDNMLIGVNVLQKSVGFGSYNLIEANVKNLKNSYTAATVYLSKIDELENLDDTSKSVLLKPNEEKTIHWIVKVKDLDQKYVYTFPMTVSTAKHVNATQKFVATSDESIFSYEQMQEIVKQKQKEEEKQYSKSVDITCSSNKELYYEYDSAIISCALKNTGNAVLKGLQICFEQDCQTTDISIAQEKVFDFTLEKLEPGVNKHEILVESDDVSKALFYDLDVLDEPEIAITNITYPKEVEYRKPYTVKFALKKTSRSAPENIKILFNAAGYTEEVELAKLETDRDYVFNLFSKDLSTKENLFTIDVEYHDQNNRKYVSSESFDIRLGKVGTGDRILILLGDLDKWLRKLFK